MTQFHTINPNTGSSRNLALKLARTICEEHEPYWGTVPRAYVVLQVRDVLRLCEDNGIWDPAHLTQIVLALFAPSFLCLPQDDKVYVLTMLSKTEADPAARARTIALAVTPDARAP